MPTDPTPAVEENAVTKLARLEQEITALQDAPSSHGEPVLPTSWTKPLFVINLILSGSVLTLLTQLDASPKVIAITSFVIATLSSLLGLTSAGIRKAGTSAAALLFVISAMSLTACRPGSYGDKLYQCEKDATVQAAVPVVECFLNGGGQTCLSGFTPDPTNKLPVWEQGIDKFLAIQIKAAPCIFDATIAELENLSHPTALDGLGGMTPDLAFRKSTGTAVALSRAYYYRQKLAAQ